MTCKVVDDHADYLIEEYSAGRTLADLARDFGVTPKVVRRVLKGKGVSINSFRTLRLPEQDIISMYLSGSSENATAKRFGVSRNVVERVLRKHGVDRRSQSAAETLKWSKMSPDQRARQVKKAHAATLGAPVPIGRRIKAAKSKERNKTVESPFEQFLIDALTEKGIDFTIQKAIGVHNADIAIGSVAVEVFGGNFHFYGKHAASHEQRCRNLFDAGYHILVIWVESGFDIDPGCADNVIRFCQFADSDPSMPRQYRMIGRGGKLFATGSEDCNEVPLKPSLCGGLDF